MTREVLLTKVVELGGLYHLSIRDYVELSICVRNYVTSQYHACLDSKANYRLKIAMAPSQPEIGDSTAMVFVTRPDKAVA